jgi:glycine/D-amino acid oxidase-like deaminating enzyme/nitrite reductase/ring-hydroxylating ferredoxin subunit
LGGAFSFDPCVSTSPPVMSVSAERTRSLWMDDAAGAPAPALDRDEKADVVVVGSGIAGLSVAYELAGRGRNVVVIDRGPIGRGMTARTTAHLASTCDDSYDALIRLHGIDLARVHYESQAAAIDRMEAIQREEDIACDFQRLDGYLFAAREEDRGQLAREYEASGQVGLGVDWVERLPSGGETSGRSLRFRNQARVHPLKYLDGLVECIRRKGGRFYSDTPATGVEESEKGVVVPTNGKHAVHARAAVFATNSPVNDRVAIHTKQAPYRTYAIAVAAPRGAIADALYWDTEDPYHYVRLQPGTKKTGDVVIIGGEDHRSGEADDGESRFAALEDWGRRRFPELGKVTHRWSGQVMEPVDHAAFIGRNPGSEHTYVATGDSGQGITTGALAGLLIANLIAHGKSRWSQLYDPSRKPIGAAGEFMRENATVVKNLSEYVTGGDVKSLDALAPGQGGVIRDGLKKIAAYRDENGQLHLRSAVCTHVGCIVHWNSLERCWDCPCHGSHFAIDGTVLNGPAIARLAEAKA